MPFFFPPIGGKDGDDEAGVDDDEADGCTNGASEPMTLPTSFSDKEAIRERCSSLVDLLADDSCSDDCMMPLNAAAGGDAVVGGAVDDDDDGVFGDNDGAVRKLLNVADDNDDADGAVLVDDGADDGDDVDEKTVTPTVSDGAVAAGACIIGLVSEHLTLRPSCSDEEAIIERCSSLVDSLVDDNCSDFKLLMTLDGAAGAADGAADDGGTMVGDGSWNIGDDGDDGDGNWLTSMVGNGDDGDVGDGETFKSTGDDAVAASDCIVNNASEPLTLPASCSDEEAIIERCSPLVDSLVDDNCSDFKLLMTINGAADDGDGAVRLNDDVVVDKEP